MNITLLLLLTGWQRAEQGEEARPGEEEGRQSRRKTQSNESIG